MTRFLATPLVALAVAGYFLCLPGQSQASGISLSITIGRPVPVVVPAYAAPITPAFIAGSFYAPAPHCAVRPAVVAYPTTYPYPAYYRPVLQPTVILPPPVVRPAHYPYWR